MALSRRWKGLLIVAPLVGALVGYLAFWPVRIDPVAWGPAPAPKLQGTYAPNDRLLHVERFAVGGEAPEDVAVDEQGVIYAGLADGRVIKLDHNGAPLGDLARTGGRPLGLAWDAGGNLIVADAEKGLLSISKTGALTVLSDGYHGRHFGLADDVDVGASGRVYFSDASDKFGFQDFLLDLLEHRNNGALYVYDPATRETTLLLDDLQFANGVAVAADESYVLVVETGNYRVTRYWLAGPQAGQSDTFIDNLPGFPDGISRGTNHRFWLAIASPRDRMVDFAAPRPWLRKVIARLPSFMRPAPKRHAFVLGLSETGKVIDNLQHNADSSFSPVTSVEEHHGHLYLGSLAGPTVARYRLRSP